MATIDSPKEQIKLAYPQIKAKISKALEDSGKVEGYVRFLLHLFKDDAFLIEWKGKFTKITFEISKFSSGKENERTVILKPT